jgi:hypothetical protein
MACAALILAAAAALAPAPAPVASEPLFVDIIARAEALEAQARAFKGKSGVDLTAFRAGLTQLSALDMQGHVTLKARGTDGDLKCILKGISEDLPKKLDQVAAATDPALRDMAVDEMVALLDDNVAVIIQPPGPATPPPVDS